MEFKIVIPTANRPDRIVSNNYFRHSNDFGMGARIPVLSVLAFRTANNTHPDKVKGLGAKRNWICDKFGTVFMIDDDIRGLQRLYSLHRKSICNPDEAYSIIQQCGNLAILTGCYLFGFNHFRNPAHYWGNEPYRMSGYVNGCGLGIVKGGKLKFHPEIVACNDFYIAGLNAYHHRKCFIDNRFVFVQKKIAAEKGGLGMVRSNDTERNDILLLKENFGDIIVAKKDTSTAKNTMKYGRTLRLPF
jgi:hypothetical protein